MTQTLRTLTTARRQLAKRIATSAVALLLTAGGALALTAQEVIDSLSAQGFTRIEVRVGPSQIKAEGIRGTEKVEIIYDAASGAMLKSESEPVGVSDNTAPGVTIREQARNFVRVVRRSGDDSGEAGDDHGGDRVRAGNRGGDDQNDDHAEDASDDHSGGGRGRDDHGSDDHGSDDHGSDDHHGSGHDDDDDDN